MKTLKTFKNLYDFLNLPMQLKIEKVFRLDLNLTLKNKDKQNANTIARFGQNCYRFQSLSVKFTQDIVTTNPLFSGEFQNVRC